MDENIMPISELENKIYSFAGLTSYKSYKVELEINL